jgi:hypothetical protein
VTNPQRAASLGWGRDSSPEFPFSLSDFNSHIDQRASLGKVLPSLVQFWSTMPRGAPGWVGLASRGHPHEMGVSFASNVTTPFGFAFGHDDVAIVSDASGGPGGTSALSSYKVQQSGDPELITPGVGRHTERCLLGNLCTGRYASTV